jgi:hypothetical protein
MVTIAKLTPDQEADIPRFVQRWRAVAVSTRPIEPQTARAAVCALCQAHGLPAPRLVLFLASPMACHFARALVQTLRSDGHLGRGKGMDQIRWWHFGDAGQALEQNFGVVYREFARALELEIHFSDEHFWSPLEDEMADVERQLLGGSRLEGRVFSRLKGQVCDLIECELSRRHSQKLAFHCPANARLSDLLQKGIEDRPWAFSVRSDAIPHFFKGGQEAPWLATYEFGMRLGASLPPRVKTYMEAFKAYVLACGWMYPDDTVGLVSERPAEMHFDAQRRLHCSTGMAIRFRDGWGAHAWHGRWVPARVMEPQHLDVRAVENETNIEWRRIMLEREYGARSGFEIYLQARQPRVLAEDEVDGLPRRLLEVDAGRRVIHVVEVVNGSAESDGTRRKFYFDARGRTPRDVIAASYGINRAVYREAVRT